VALLAAAEGPNDGSLVMTMDVCDDYTLRSWILSFGRAARVLAPAQLVEWISEELEQAGRQYDAGALLPSFDDGAQPLLPFAFERLASLPRVVEDDAAPRGSSESSLATVIGGSRRGVSQSSHRPRGRMKLAKT
jgi:WYL domain